MSRIPKIGVFGGTFDPVHRGHLTLLKAAQKHFKFDFVYVVPTGRNPLKGAAQSSRAERLRRLRAAVIPLGFVRICLAEWKGRGPQYTVDTLRLLRKRHPAAELFFICGSDSLESFGRWKNPRGILRLARVAAAQRGGCRPVRARAGVVLFPMKPVNLSSTQIRSKKRRGI